MWLAIILTLLIGVCIMPFVYISMVGNDAGVVLDQLSPSEFRNKVLKEPYDNIGGDYSDYGYYKNRISLEGEIKYLKYETKLKRKEKTINILIYSIPVFILLIAVVGFAFLGAFLDKESLNKEVAKYEAQKTTIEMSLDNKDLTGLERIELVKQASELNSWLAEEKYSVQKWYNFYLDENVVINLEPVNLKNNN